jgi:hypothetical protein
MIYEYGLDIHYEPSQCLEVQFDPISDDEENLDLLPKKAKKKREKEVKLKVDRIEDLEIHIRTFYERFES